MTQEEWRVRWEENERKRCPESQEKSVPSGQEVVFASQRLAGQVQRGLINRWRSQVTLVRAISMEC